MGAVREFALTDENFANIAQRVYEACGIVLGPHKKEMVYSRLARRIRARQMSSFTEYLNYLDEHKEAELSHFLNAITTNLTSFFREMHHFDYLTEHIIPRLKQQHQVDKRIRFWSAGCSTGEEPYSLAMTIANAFPPGWDVKILATDLDSNVLKKAQEGVYESSSINGLDASTLKKWFLKSADGKAYKVKPQLQSAIAFKRLNLLEEPWPMKGPFDVIFCRNVLIYFDKETKDKLFHRYYDLLGESGHLFIGHSETMGKEREEFRNLGKTMYQKVLTNAAV